MKFVQGYALYYTLHCQKVNVMYSLYEDVFFRFRPRILNNVAIHMEGLRHRRRQLRTFIHNQADSHQIFSAQLHKTPVDHQLQNLL